MRKKCARGNSLLFSIRDPQMKRISTLKLAIDTTSSKVRQISHFGLRNTTPNASDCLDATELIEQLNSSTFANAIQLRKQFQQYRAELQQQVVKLRTERKKDYLLITQKVAWECEYGRITI